MIKGLSPRGSYIYIHGGDAADHIYSQPGAQGVGNIRFNTTIQDFEVYDGQTWITLKLPTAMIGLTKEAEDLLDWVKDLRTREYEIENLAKDNLAVKNALINLQKAKEQLDITIILSKNEKTSN